MEGVWCAMWCGFAAVSQRLHSKTRPNDTRPPRQSRTVPMYTAPSHGVGLDCLLLLCNIHILQPTSLKGSASLYPGLLYILGFMPPFLVFFWYSITRQAFLGALQLVCQSLRDWGPQPIAASLHLLQSRTRHGRRHRNLDEEFCNLPL